MDKQYDYIVSDMTAFKNDYANGLTNDSCKQYSNCENYRWVIKRTDEKKDFPYSICVIKTDGNIETVDYCNDRRIHKWLVYGIIRESTAEDFINNEQVCAYLFGLQQLNIHVEYNDNTEKAVLTVLNNTRLTNYYSISKYAAESFSYFAYILSTMATATTIRVGGKNA